MVEGAVVALSRPVVQESLVVNRPAHQDHLRLSICSTRCVVFSGTSRLSFWPYPFMCKLLPIGWSLICVTKGVFTSEQALRHHKHKVSTLHQQHDTATSAQHSPWEIGSSVFITFQAARGARPLATRLVPIASRRILSSWGWLLPHSRVGRGGGGVSGVVVAGHSTPLKANHSPLGVG